MLTEFQGLFGEETYGNLQKRRYANFRIQTDLNGNIPFCSAYCISLGETMELWRQIDKAICCSWSLPLQSNFCSPVLLMAKPDSILCMFIDCCAVNNITIKDCYSLPRIEDLLNTIYGSLWLTNWTWQLLTNIFALPQLTGKRWLSTLNFVCMSGASCRLAWPHMRQFMRLMNCILESM